MSHRTYTLSGCTLWALLALGGAGCTEKPLLERVNAAMGGDKASVEVVESSGRRLDYGEGLSPTQPLLMSEFVVKRTADASGPRVRQEFTIDAKALLPQQLTFTETLSGQHGYVQGNDSLFGSRSPQTALVSPRIAVPQRHTELTSPLRLLRQALASPEAVSERPDATFNGRAHHVLALRSEGAPEVLLFIDPDTHLIAKAETLEDHPPMGDARVEILYKDYRSSNGVMVPFEVSVLVDGQAVHTETRTTAQALATADATAFEVPTSFHLPHSEEQAERVRRSSQWYMGFYYGGFSFFFFDQTGSAVQDVELAPGVRYLRGSTHHNLLIEQQDSLVIVDAPMYVGRTSSVLAHIKANYPNKPLRHVVASHFHQDHSGGIREFAAEGNVTVYAGKPSEEYFKRVFTHPHTVVPDRLQLNPKPVTVRAVDSSLTLEDPQRPVALYRIANSHSEDLLIIYLPQQKLLFTADVFRSNPATNGRLLSGTYRQWAAELYNEVTRLGLDVQQIVGAHGEGIATLADVKAGAGL